MVTVKVKQGHLESRLAITPEQSKMFGKNSDELQKRFYNLCKDFNLVHHIEKHEEGFISVAEGPVKEATIHEDELSEFNQTHLNFIEEAEKIYEDWKDSEDCHAIPADAEKEQDSDEISMLKEMLEDAETNNLFVVICRPICPNAAVKVGQIGYDLFKKLLEYYVKGHQ